MLSHNPKPETPAGHTDILFFMEDPGAINCMIGLEEELSKQGWKTRVLTTDTGRQYVQERGVCAEVVTCSENTKKLFHDIAPRLLFVGTTENKNSPLFSLIAESKASGVTTVGIVDIFANALERFRGNSEHPLTFAPDWLIIPDKRTLDVYARAGYPEQRLMLSGQPHFDTLHQQREELNLKGKQTIRAQVFPRVEIGRPVAVFAAELSTSIGSPLLVRTDDYTIRGRGLSAQRTEIVMEEFLDAAREVAPDAYLVLRLHPKNTREEFETYLHEFNEVSQGGHFLSALFAADVCVGMTSMILAEAAFMGCKAIAIIPRPQEKEWLPFQDEMSIPCAFSRSDVRKELKKALSSRDTSSETDSCVHACVGAKRKAVEFLTCLLNNTQT